MSNSDSYSSDEDEHGYVKRYYEDMIESQQHEQKQKQEKEKEIVRRKGLPQLNSSPTHQTQTQNNQTQNDREENIRRLMVSPLSLKLHQSSSASSSVVASEPVITTNAQNAGFSPSHSPSSQNNKVMMTNRSVAYQKDVDEATRVIWQWTSSQKGSNNENNMKTNINKVNNNDNKKVSSLDLKVIHSILAAIRQFPSEFCYYDNNSNNNDARGFSYYDNNNETNLNNNHANRNTNKNENENAKEKEQTKCFWKFSRQKLEEYSSCQFIPCFSPPESLIKRLLKFADEISIVTAFASSFSSSSSSSNNFFYSLHEDIQQNSENENSSFSSTRNIVRSAISTVALHIINSVLIWATGYEKEKLSSFSRNNNNNNKSAEHLLLELLQEIESKFRPSLKAVLGLMDFVREFCSFQETKLHNNKELMMMDNVDRFVDYCDKLASSSSSSASASSSNNNTNNTVCSHTNSPTSWIYSSCVTIVLSTSFISNLRSVFFSSCSGSSSSLKLFAPKYLSFQNRSSIVAHEENSSSFSLFEEMYFIQTSLLNFSQCQVRAQFREVVSMFCNQLCSSSFSTTGTTIDSNFDVYNNNNNSNNEFPLIMKLCVTDNGEFRFAPKKKHSNEQEKEPEETKTIHTTLHLEKTSCWFSKCAEFVLDKELRRMRSDLRSSIILLLPQNQPQSIVESSSSPLTIAISLIKQLPLFQSWSILQEKLVDKMLLSSQPKFCNTCGFLPSRGNDSDRFLFLLKNSASSQNININNNNNDDNQEDSSASSSLRKISTATWCDPRQQQQGVQHLHRWLKDVLSDCHFPEDCATVTLLLGNFSSSSSAGDPSSSSSSSSIGGGDVIGTTLVRAIASIQLTLSLQQLSTSSSFRSSTNNRSNIDASNANNNNTNNNNSGSSSFQTIHTLFMKALPSFHTLFSKLFSTLLCLTFSTRHLQIELRASRSSSNREYWRLLHTLFFALDSILRFLTTEIQTVVSEFEKNLLQEVSSSSSSGNSSSGSGCSLQNITEIFQEFSNQLQGLIVLEFPVSSSSSSSKNEQQQQEKEKETITKNIFGTSISSHVSSLCSIACESNRPQQLQLSNINISNNNNNFSLERDLQRVELTCRSLVGVLRGLRLETTETRVEKRASALLATLTFNRYF